MNEDNTLDIRQSVGDVGGDFTKSITIESGGEEIRNQYLIVQNGDLAGMGAHSYTKGTATGGSEEAAEFKK